MNKDILQNLLQNLLNTTVYTAETDLSFLRFFEEKHCFHANLQPMFTAHALQYLVESMKPNTFYEIIDKLGTCLFFFSYEKIYYFIGPYVYTTYDEHKTEAELIENHIPASYALSFKLYYTALPLLASTHIQHIVHACLKSFSISPVEYSYRRLQGFHEQVQAAKIYQEHSVNYDDIYKRYDNENMLLKLIEKGDSAHISQTFSAMIQLSSEQMDMFNSTVYHSPTAIIRALSRKAAERSGLSVVKIDEITQKAVHQMTSATTASEQNRLLLQMLTDLAQAVHEHLQHTQGMSEPIKKIVEYIALNYTQNITIADLAKHSHMSASHLSKLFKEETHQTITQYIAAYRCRQAAEMLKNTTLSISDISSYVGYSDNNYFVKVFKKVYGMTPGAYRIISADTSPSGSSR